MSLTSPNLDGPALQPPPHVTPDFDAVGLGYFQYPIFITYVSISTVLLGACVYTRLFVIRKHGMEDYTLWLSWAIIIAFCGCTIPLHRLGFGKHQWNVRLRNLSDAIYWFHVCTILYDFGFMMLKISIVTQYRKIFAPLNKRSFMWWGTWSLTILFIIFYLTAALLNIWICQPMEKLWKPSIPGRCMSTHAINISSSSFNTATDFILVLMPQLSIRRLHLPKRTQLGLAAIFSIGTFASIASCIRIYYSVALSQTKDITFVGYQLGLWCVAELGVGIICACLPVLPRFLQSTLYQSTVYKYIAGALNSSFEKIRSRKGKTINTSSDRSQPSADALEGTSLESLNRQRDPKFSRQSLDPEDGGIVKTVDISTRTEPWTESSELPSNQQGWP